MFFFKGDPTKRGWDGKMLTLANKGGREGGVSGPPIFADIFWEQLFIQASLIKKRQLTKTVGLTLKLWQKV